MRKVIAMIALVPLFALAGCGDIQPTSDELAAQKSEQAARNAEAQVGQPAVPNLAEKRLLKLIYELRDNADLETYVYKENLNGTYTFICHGFGFGLPYGTQFTNPQKLAGEQIDKGYLVLPQAEPNQLFSPASADATWAICKSKRTGKPVVHYAEEHLHISPEPLDDAIVVNPPKN